MKYLIEKNFPGDKGILKRIKEGEIDVEVVPLNAKWEKWEVSERQTRKHLFGEDTSDDDITREEAIKLLVKAGYDKEFIDK